MEVGPTVWFIYFNVYNLILAKKITQQSNALNYWSIDHTVVILDVYMLHSVARVIQAEMKVMFSLKHGSYFL